MDLRCDDRICDTSSERFTLEIDAPSSGQKVSVRVHDAAGNVVTLEVPGSAFKGGK